MDDYGTYVDASTVRFHRDFPVAPGMLWNHLTRPELLKPWLAEAVLPLKLDAGIVLRFPGHDLTPPRPGSVITGAIIAVEPPHRLAYGWSDPTMPGTSVEFVIEAVGGGSRLTLTHSNFPAAALHNCAAAWHSHLAMLGAVLLGRTPEEFGTIFGRVRPVYKERLPKA